MNIISWNVRGAARRPILLYIVQDLVRDHNITILLITGLYRLFAASDITCGNGYTGGVWIFWDPACLTLTRVEAMNKRLSESTSTKILLGGSFSLLCFSSVAKQEGTLAVPYSFSLLLLKLR